MCVCADEHLFCRVKGGCVGQGERASSVPLLTIIEVKETDERTTEKSSPLHENHVASRPFPR